MDIFDYNSANTGTDAPSLPSSFLSLVDTLRDTSSLSGDEGDSSSSSKLDSSTRAMCYLMKRFIATKPNPLLPFLVSRNGLIDTTVEVLVMLLTSSGTNNNNRESAANTSISCTASNSSSSASQDIREMAGKELLTIIGSNSYLCQKIRTKPGMFSSLPLSLTIPRLLSSTASASSSNGVSSAKASSAACTVLTDIVERYAATNADMLAKILIDELSKYDEGASKGQSKTERSPEHDYPMISSNALCAKFTGSWRRSLLENPARESNAYANILVEIGNIMFQIPQSSVPLTLFGAIVGDGSDIQGLLSKNQGASCHCEARIFRVTLDLLELSLDKLKKSTGTSRQSLPTPNLFSRLSPLLLLRRIPSSYFRTLHRILIGTRHQSDNKRAVRMINELSDFLVARLDVETKGHHQHITFTAEERQLSAELAARCLPFVGWRKQDVNENLEVGESLNCCFDRVCAPAFTELLESRFGPSDCSMEETFKRARAAVYAACHYVSVAEDNENGIGIFGILAFVLKVISIEPTDNQGNAYDGHLIQLQTGCIDFITLCLISCVQRQLQCEQDREGGSRLSNGPLVQELSTLNEVKKSDSTSTGSIKTVRMALIEVFSLVIDIITTRKMRNNSGDVDFKSFVRKNNQRREQVSQGETIEFSPTARTCLLNSFILASQRCQPSQLTLLARKCLPKTIDWALGGRIDSDIRHPLCIAAALQMTFVLVTRSKSLDVLENGSGQTRKDWVRRTHKWSLAAIKGVVTSDSPYAISSMRLAALKLILALVSIDQNVFSENGGCLSPSEIVETFSVLRGAANVDEEPAMRKLACHILEAIQKY